MEYAKGTWTIQPMPHRNDLRQGEVYIIRDERNCALAEVGEIDAIFDGEENKANARLIAAAPEMYEALKYLTNTVAQYSQYTVDNSESYRMALKALSKAEKRA